jgi:hypothetical protein
MLAAIDAYLIGGIGVALQARRALAEQRAAKGAPGPSSRAALPRSITPRAWALASRCWPTSMQPRCTRTCIHEKLCSHGTAAQPQAQQRGHQALHQRSILVGRVELERSSAIGSEQAWDPSFALMKRASNAQETRCSH